MHPPHHKPVSNKSDRGARPRSLRWNFSWVMLGNVVYAGSQWAALILLVKLSTPGTVGRFALGLAVTAPVMMFASMQLRAVQVTDIKRLNTFGEYLCLRTLTSVLGMVAITVIVHVTGYRGEDAWVIYLWGVAKAIESFSDTFYGVFQRNECLDRMARSLIVRGLLGLTLLGVTFAITDHLPLALFAMSSAWLFVLLAHDVPAGIRLLRASSATSTSRGNAARSLFRCRLSALGRLALIGLPLGAIVGLNSLNTNIPRYFIELHRGKGALGVFAAIAIFMRVGFYIETALAQATLPQLSRRFGEGNPHHFTSLVLKVLGMGMLIGIGGILVAAIFGTAILDLLGEEYAPHRDTFIWVMVAAAVGYLVGFCKNATNAARRFLVQLPIFICSTAVTAVASHMLIRHIGLRGAAISLVLGRGVLLLGYVFTLVHVVRESRNAGTSEMAAP